MKVTNFFETRQNSVTINGLTPRKHEVLLEA